jgi:hypothetical protein
MTGRMLSRNLGLSMLGVIAIAPASQMAQAQTAAATVRASSIGGLGFAYPAIRSSDADLKGILLSIADSLNLECGRMEAFTWPGIVPQSDRGQEVFLSIIEALEVKGYQYVQRDLPVPKDEDLAMVQQEMRAYSSESADRHARDKHILTVWYREPDEVHLMVCAAMEKKPLKAED